jgi:hypothetical protein
LKSCYHRNLETFKQIYAFEAFLARAPISSSAQLDNATSVSPSSSTHQVSALPTDANEVEALPNPAYFLTATDRHVFLERKLEAARALNVPVANLTIKVIDHWHDMGWFALFKKRFQEDPKTGLPIPRYAADREADVDAEGEEVQEESEQIVHGPGIRIVASTAEARRRHLDPTDCLIPPPLPNPVVMSRSSGSTRALRSSPPLPVSAAPTSTPIESQFIQGSSHYSHSVQSSPMIPHGGYSSHTSLHWNSSPPLSAEYQMQYHQQQLQFQVQTVQTLTHLSNLTQTLVGTCSTLVELARAQSEDIRLQTELLRRREEHEDALARGGPRPRTESNETPEASANRPELGEQMGMKNTAALATEILSSTQVADEVKHAAAEYLKRIFQ